MTQTTERSLVALISDGLDAAISRGLAYAPYADLIWCETGKPDLDEAKRFVGECLVKLLRLSLRG